MSRLKKKYYLNSVWKKFLRQNGLSEGQLIWVDSSDLSKKQAECVKKSTLLEAVRAECLNQLFSQEKPKKTSISHTEELCVGVSIFDSHSRVYGIGIDVEAVSRKTLPRRRRQLFDRVVQVDERDFGLEFLEYWVIKESCFKSNPKNTGTVVPQYVLIAWDARSRTGEVVLRKGRSVCTDFRFKVRVLKCGDWYLGYALCLRYSD